MNVLNASTVDGIAHDTATALTNAGFKVAEIGNASQLTEGSDSEILYGPTGYGAALSLGATLSGPVTYMPDSDLSGNTVSLLIAGSSLTVTGSTRARPPRPRRPPRRVPGRDDDDHDDPLRRLHEHRVGAVEPLPVHPGRPTTTTTTVPVKKALKK